MGAIVKARYGRGAKAVGAAKDHVRYIVHRADEWGNRQHRELWDDGQQRLDKQTAYGELDQADGYIYRLILSPDPRTQDADQTLDLRVWSESVMEEVKVEHPGVRWFAAEHQDRDHRHVHVVALTRDRLDVDDFRSMRAAADANASDQQRQAEREHSQVLDRDLDR